MRALIPVTQEDIPWKSIERAKVLCDEVTLLYVVERKLVDLVEAEASYIIPHHELESAEHFVVKLQRERAEELASTLRRDGLRVTLLFEVGNFAALVRERAHGYDIVMTDAGDNRLLYLDVPLWVDRGGMIRECVFVVHTAVKVRKLRGQLEFVREICRLLGCSMAIYYPGHEREVVETLRAYGDLVNKVEGDLLCVQRERKGLRYIRKWRKNLLLLR